MKCITDGVSLFDERVVLTGELTLWRTVGVPDESMSLPFRTGYKGKGVTFFILFFMTTFLAPAIWMFLNILIISLLEPSPIGVLLTILLVALIYGWLVIASILLTALSGSKFLEIGRRHLLDERVLRRAIKWEEVETVRLLVGKYGLEALSLRLRSRPQRAFSFFSPHILHKGVARGRNDVIISLLLLRPSSIQIARVICALAKEAGATVEGPNW